MDATYTQFVTAAAALAAVIVGPLASLCIAKRQIRATVVSTSRKEWIDALRSTLAKFLASQERFAYVYAISKEPKALAEEFAEFYALTELIQLYLNPNEPTHKQLMRAVRDTHGILVKVKNGEEDAFDEWIDCQRRITECAQVILKSEWDRVKRGD